MFCRVTLVDFVRLLMVFVLSGVLFFTPCIIATEIEWGKVSAEEWAKGVPAQLTKANAIILHDICTLTVNPYSIENIRWVRVKLLNKAGSETIRDIGFDYYEGDDISKLDAQTIRPDGSILKVDRKDFFTKSSGGSLRKTFAFPGLDSGCIVEFRYRNLNQRFYLLPTWYFQSAIYTCRSTLILVLYPGFTYNSLWLNVPDSAQEIKEKESHSLDVHATLRSYTYEMTDLIPLSDDIPFLKNSADHLSSIHLQLQSYRGQAGYVSFVRDWKDIGETFQEFTDEYARKGDLKRRVQQIVEKAVSAEDTIRLLYNYVAKEIQLRESDYRWFDNENFSELFKKGSGTGSEKNVLLSYLLREVKLNAWPVLISTRNYRTLIPQIPQINQLNYIIAFVSLDSAFLFMDAANKYCQFGMLPPKCLVDVGFLLDGKESKLIKLISNEPSSSRLDISYLHISSDGNVTCSTTIGTTGYITPRFGTLLEELGETELAKQYFLDNLDQQYELDTVAAMVKDAGNFEIMMKYALHDYIVTLDSNYAFKPVSFRFRTNPFVDESRAIPVDFNYPFSYHTITVAVGDNLTDQATLPHDTSLTIEGASFHRVSQFLGNELTIEHKLTIDSAEFPVSRYSELRGFFESVALLQQERIAVKIR